MKEQLFRAHSASDVLVDVAYSCTFAGNKFKEIKSPKA